jgi:Fur family peroxide stress response transcriptional regulator
MRPRAESSHRELILGIVRRSDRHPTADDVFMSARGNVPTISLTTVYRNLRRLVTEGQLRERMFGGVSRFDAHLEEHGHLVCTSCGAIVDLAADGPTLTQHLKPTVEAWRVDHVDVELRGRCPACLRKAARPVRSSRRRAR